MTFANAMAFKKGHILPSKAEEPFASIQILLGRTARSFALKPTKTRSTSTGTMNGIEKLSKSPDHKFGYYYRVYGATSGVDKGYPGSRGWPRVGGVHKKDGINQ